MGAKIKFFPKQFNYKVLPRVLEYINALDDAEYVLNITKAKNTRTLTQNAYFHALVGDIAEVTGKGFEEVKIALNTDYGTIARDETGKKIGFMLPQGVDVSSIYKYTKWFDEREINGTVFNCYIVFKETHTLNTAEMKRLIEGAVQEAQNLGIETLSESEIALLKE